MSSELFTTDTKNKKIVSYLLNNTSSTQGHFNKTANYFYNSDTKQNKH